tara:strand:- start:21950 stop:23044 length:1095 start_codon:yes stop_codon:yes gene_type:complete
MRFFKRKFREYSLENEIKKRWLPSSCGLILDNLRNLHPVWKVESTFFEKFLSGIENRSGVSLGRRLAHASSESEEFLSKISGFPAPKGSNPAKWSDTKLDWLTRGIGNFELLDKSDEIRIIIRYPINGPICTGIFSSNWELATKNRHRFRWTQNKSESLILELSEDDIEIPQPNETTLSWRHVIPEISFEDDEYLWDSLEVESEKYWSLMGSRYAMINQDLIIRFESYYQPYLNDIHEGRFDSFEWEGVDSDKSLLWTIFSDTIREIFYDQAHHILISETDDWINVSKRHLSKQGLGKINYVKSIDNFGGIECSFNSCFHPAIFCGILSGCWERANGRKVKCNFSDNGETNIVRLMSMNEISSN